MTRRYNYEHTCCQGKHTPIVQLHTCVFIASFNILGHSKHNYSCQMHLRVDGKRTDEPQPTHTHMHVLLNLTTECKVKLSEKPTSSS